MPVGLDTGSVVREGSQGLFSMAKGHFGDETRIGLGWRGSETRKESYFIFLKLLFVEKYI